MSKSILITGSTDGIGKLAASKLARDGHNIYLHGRDEKKLANSIEEIRKASQNDQIEGFVGDLSNMETVLALANQIKSSACKLDVLINNAGVYKSSVATNKLDLDMRIAVNYLAPVLLTESLIPLLEKEAGSRIINLSSAAQSTISLDLLKGKSNLSVGEAYAQSKLALTMWGFYMAKKYPDIIVIAVNPGSLLDTKMVQEAFGQSFSSAARGADILYDLALSEKYSGSSGKYFDNDRGAFGPAHPDTRDDQKILHLTKATNSALNLEI